jgi:phosphate:Na+ symporter
MIAIVHSIFNVVTTFILVPFTKQLEKLANIIIPDVKTDEDEQMVILDERLLTVPALAIKESFDVIVNMAHVSKKAFIKATEMLNSYTEEKAEKVSSLEDKLDKYEDQLGTYMMKVSKVGISEEDSKTVAKILHTIDDFERIGDHAMNIVEVAKELYDKQQAFSDDANDNIATLNEAVNELVDMTITAFETNDLHLAAKVEPLEQVVDLIILKIKKKHIKRLQDGDCTIQLGFALSDFDGALIASASPVESYIVPRDAAIDVVPVHCPSALRCKVSPAIICQ